MVWAAMELRVALREELGRLPDMRFANDDPEVEPHSPVRSCTRMDVHPTPEKG